MNATIPPELLHFENDGVVPNSPLPLLHYRGAFRERGEEAAVWLETTFRRHGWANSWRNGVYGYHHYHTNTHEVLGVYQGSALLQLGGEAGAKVEVAAGDVIVIPAGVGHKRLRASGDFAVVGAYPDGREPETLGEGELSMDDALERIRRVPVPEADPVRGSVGWPGIWRQAGA
jgi:uncharacterized protein YjlB